MMFDYVDPSDFKIYMNDIGLLTQHPGMPALLLLSDIEIDNTFMGGSSIFGLFKQAQQQFFKKIFLYLRYSRQLLIIPLHEQ